MNTFNLLQMICLNPEIKVDNVCKTIKFYYDKNERDHRGAIEIYKNKPSSNIYSFFKEDSLKRMGCYIENNIYSFFVDGKKICNKYLDKDLLIRFFKYKDITI